MDVTIRPATPQDYKELCIIFSQVDKLHSDNLPHIFQQTDGPARDEAYILELLANEAVGLFVAEREGQLLGFVQVMFSESPPLSLFVPRRYALVDALAVREEFRREGIGWALMQRAEQWALDKGASSIDLNVHEFNQNAVNFYQKLGYLTASRKMSKAIEQEDTGNV